MNIELSQSFRMGTGSINHNLRINNDGTERSCGDTNRRFLNEHLFIDPTIPIDDNYAERLIRKNIYEAIKDRLKEYNEKQIKSKHPERVLTYEKWLENQIKKAKEKPRLQEYIIQLGDRYTGCPYKMETDKDGNIIDIDGNKIKNYDTTKTPAYKDGKITPSKLYKKTKKIFKEFIKEFQKANPQAVVISASIHGDEEGGLHCHISVLWLSKTKQCLGIGLGHTQAMAQQYEAQGIKTKDTKEKNAQTLWESDMRWLLKEVAERNGIKRKDMGNEEEPRTIKGFKRDKDKEVQLKRKEEELKEKERYLKEREANIEEKEREISRSIVKEEWYILRKQYPEIYTKVHEKFKGTLKTVKKGLDKKDNRMI